MGLIEIMLKIVNSAPLKHLLFSVNKNIVRGLSVCDNVIA